MDNKKMSASFDIYGKWLEIVRFSFLNIEI